MWSILFLYAIPLVFGQTRSPESLHSRIEKIIESTLDVPGPLRHHLADTNLLIQYKKEIREVEKEWKKKAIQLRSSPSSDDFRVRKNKFYSTELNRRNHLTFKSLTDYFTDTSLTGFSSQAVAALEAVRSSPLGTPDSQRWGGQIGYCFGRAFVTHLSLLENGIAAKWIGKIFTVGDLLVDRKMWNFHVAMFVYDPVWGALVVDPIHEKPLPIWRWIAINSDYGIKRQYSRVRFYLTGASRFLPQPGEYLADDMLHPLYNGYFELLAKKSSTSGAPP